MALPDVAASSSFRAISSGEIRLKKGPARSRAFSARLRLLREDLFTLQTDAAAYAGAEVPSDHGRIADVRTTGAVGDVAKIVRVPKVAIDSGELGISRGVEIPGAVDNTGQCRGREA